MNVTSLPGLASLVGTGFVHAKLTFHLIQSVPTKAGVAKAEGGEVSCMIYSGPRSALLMEEAEQWNLS